MTSEFIQKKKIGEILMSKGLITPQQLETALRIQREDRTKRVGEIWVEAGIITEEVLARALAAQYSVQYFDLANFVPKEDMSTLVSEDLVNIHQVLPVKLDGNVLTIVTHDPTNIAGFQTIARTTGFHVKFVVAQKTALQKMIAKVTSSAEQTLADVDIDEVLDQVNLEVASREDDDDRLDGVDLDSLRKESNQGAIVQFVNKLLLQAIQERATDVHIESTLKDVLVRYRIDGLLYDRTHVDRKNYNAILSRIKILCDVDITERTIPQDGGFKVKLKGRNIDFRVSILPSIYGQNVVIRILGASGLELKLSELGFEPNDLVRYQKGMLRPYGWVLVTGPTGSGKTTTLYSSLSTLNKRDTKIITVEDPVEYKLAGIHQTQVRINKSDPERSMTFAKAPRPIMRQDPHVIMIGEIRDYETPAIADGLLGVLHVPRHHLGRHDRPSPEHRHRQLPVRGGAKRRRCAATGAAHLPRVQGAHLRHPGRADRLGPRHRPVHGLSLLQGTRLRLVQPHRRDGPGGDLRGDADERLAPPAHHR